MSWKQRFSFGRPNRESLFEVNPGAVTWTDRLIADRGRAVEGSRLRVSSSRFRPKITLNSAYISPDQWNQLRALVMADDTFLVFQAHDGSIPNTPESWTERVIPTSLTTVPIRDNSYLRGSALRVAAGGPSAVSIVGLWDDLVPDAGRLGYGPDLSRTPNAYMTGFEPPLYSLANVVGQDGWASSNGTGTLAVVSSPAASILSGTQSVCLTVTGSGSKLVHRAIPSTVGPYAVSWRMQQGSTTFNGLPELGVSTGTYPAAFVWNVQRINATTLRINDDAGIHNITLPEAAPFDHQVAIAGTVMTVFYNGVLVFTGTVAAPTFTDIGFGIVSSANPSTASVDFIRITGGGYAAAAYNDATRVVTLATALPNLNPRFLTYGCPVVAVDPGELPTSAEGGNTDFYKYVIELEGA